MRVGVGQLSAPTRPASYQRKRTLGQFCFHLSDRPDRALNAYLVGVYTNEDRGREVHHVLGDVGFEEVARHVEEVLRRVTAALSGPTDSRAPVNFCGVCPMYGL